MKIYIVTFAGYAEEEQEHGISGCFFDYSKAQDFFFEQVSNGLGTDEFRINTLEIDGRKKTIKTVD